MSQTSKLILGAATCALSLVSAADESWAFEESDTSRALELGSAGIAASVVTRLMAFHQKTIIDARSGAALGFERSF